MLKVDVFNKTKIRTPKVKVTNSLKQGQTCKDQI